jgi:MacB-like periplasmic core domain
VDGDLFADVDAVGQQITVGGSLFTVIGVLAPKGGAGFADPNDLAIAPVTAVQQALTGYGPLNQILIQASAADTVGAAQAEVTAILNHRLHVTGAAPYRILNQAHRRAVGGGGRGHRQPVHHRRRRARDRAELGAAGPGRLERHRPLLRQLSGQPRGGAAADRGVAL